LELYILIVAIIVLLFVLILVGGGAQRNKDLIKAELPVAEKLVKGNISQVKEGIMKFDNILNKSLQAKGFRGQTLGERLKSANRYFKWNDYSGIWEAHKLRNKIVHEDHDPGGTEIKKSVKYFKLAINKLLK